MKPNEEISEDESSLKIFYAVKRIALELLIQMRNSSCQEQFSLSASSEHQSKFPSTTAAVTIKSIKGSVVIVSKNL